MISLQKSSPPVSVVWSIREIRVMTIKNLDVSYVTYKPLRRMNAQL